MSERDDALADAVASIERQRKSRWRSVERVDRTIRPCAMCGRRGRGMRPHQFDAGWLLPVDDGHPGEPDVWLCPTRCAGRLRAILDIVRVVPA